MFVWTGGFFDIETLKETYKGRECQLEAILRNARKMWHPNRQTWVYQDMNFKLLVGCI